MTEWAGATADGSYRVLIEARALSDLDRMCQASGQIETGGVLVGYYSSDLSVAVVCEATLPPSDSRRGRSSFVRGIAGLREMFRRRWRSKIRTYYLGEWHFHPARQVEPSSDDVAQMAKIASADEYSCREPILVILCAAHRNARRALRAFVCPRGISPLEFGEDAAPVVPSTAKTQ